MKESCADAGAQVSRTDFGLMGGAGVTFNDVSLGVLYDYGLTKVETGSDLKSRSIAFTAGFKLRSW